MSEAASIIEAETSGETPGSVLRRASTCGALRRGPPQVQGDAAVYLVTRADNGERLGHVEELHGRWRWVTYVVWQFKPEALEAGELWNVEFDSFGALAAESGKWLIERPTPPVDEAEDPKSVFKAATAKAVPSRDKGGDIKGGPLRRLAGRYPVEGVYIWFDGQHPGHVHGEGILQILFRNYGLVRQKWASYGVLANALMNWRNLCGARLWIDGEPAGVVSSSNERLRTIANAAWRPGGHLGAEAVAEAKKKKPAKPAEPAEPPVKENPKDFFLRMISTGIAGRTQAYAEVLDFMPDDFVQAYQQKRHATWEQDDASGLDWWPVYDEDADRWSQVVFYFEYETDAGKIDLIVREQDSDGNHEFVDAAEIGTPEAVELEKTYGADGWGKATLAYWEYVDGHGVDPLSYIHIAPIETVSTFLLGFVRRGADLLRLAFVRLLTPEKPSPPAVSFEEAQRRATQDPLWKEALEYAAVNAVGVTEATEAEIEEEGGRWDSKGRLVLRHDFTRREAPANEAELLREKAQEAIERLTNLG